MRLLVRGEPDPLYRNAFLVELSFIPVPAAPHSADAIGNPRDIVQKTGQPLSPRKRAVERGHGAGMSGIVIVHPSAQN